MTLRLLPLPPPTLPAPAGPRPEAPAPGGDPSRPATALGPEVPRGAMARFLDACREGHYARAAEYLNLRQLPQAVRAQRGPELARELETVLDRALWVDLDRLSDQPEGDPEDGLPALRDSLGTIETATGPVEVLIERVSQPGGVPVWKIAASTVAAIPALYAAGLRVLARAGPVQRFLVAGEKALAIVAATWLVLRGLDVLVARFERRLDESRHVRAVATVPLGRRTLKVFVAVVALIAALQDFGFNVTGLIAGLGVGGRAVALAAQKTVENLFGSVSLVADQPVRVGDVCR